MTIQQANQYFAALPDGFADPAQLGALLPASVQQVQFVGVAGTAGKTAVARLLAAILHAQGIPGRGFPPRGGAPGARPPVGGQPEGRRTTVPPRPGPCGPPRGASAAA